MHAKRIVPADDDFEPKSFAQIESLIRRLNGRSYDAIFLYLFPYNEEPNYIAIAGGDERRDTVAFCSPDGKHRSLHDPSASPMAKVMIAVGGQGGEFRAGDTVDLGQPSELGSPSRFEVSLTLG